MTRQLSVVEAGQLDYLEAWELQRSLARMRRDGRIDDTLLLTEHPPTYTIGRRGSRENLLIDEATLTRIGARCYEVDRGGDITFHGPGQLVAYLIMDLGRGERALRRYVSSLEQAVIATLNRYGIDGQVAHGRPGVWVSGRKIAALGVAVSRRVTYHGFALNIQPDLHYFDFMIPCGIPGSAATSMRHEVEHHVEFSEVAVRVVEELCDVFGQVPRQRHLETLRQRADDPTISFR
jgi:lipoate-protein ligase B